MEFSAEGLSQARLAPPRSNGGHLRGPGQRQRRGEQGSAPFSPALPVRVSVCRGSFRVRQRSWVAPHLSQNQAPAVPSPSGAMLPPPFLGEPIIPQGSLTSWPPNGPPCPAACVMLTALQASAQGTHLAVSPLPARWTPMPLPGAVSSVVSMRPHRAPPTPGLSACSC